MIDLLCFMSVGRTVAVITPTTVLWESPGWTKCVRIMRLFLSPAGVFTPGGPFLSAAPSCSLLGMERNNSQGFYYAHF